MKKIKHSGILQIRKLHYIKQTKSPTKGNKSNQTNSPNKSENRQNKLLPNPCSGCSVLHWYRECTFRNKKCDLCKHIGHKGSHCRFQNKFSSSIKNTKSVELDDVNTRKFVNMKILKRNVKFQLDSRSDLTILNIHMWRKLGKPTMLKSNKIASSITGENINFKGKLITTATFMGKTLKLKLFVLKNTNNLFGTDCMTQFRLWDLPVNSYCQKVENYGNEAEKLKTDLKQTYLEVFSSGLGRCTKMLAKFKLNDNAQPVFKKKCNVSFASLEQINEELDGLEKTGVLAKVQYNDWALPTLYVKKKSKEICICTDFSTGLNATLKDFNYLLPCLEDMFAKLNGRNLFSKIDLSDAYL